MKKPIITALVSAFIATTLCANESEDFLKVSIIEKASQFVTLKESGGDTVVVTVLNNPYGDLFDKVFAGKTINSKKVKIKYINSIDKLEDTGILYIANVSSENLSNVLKKATNKNMLTVSDIRGFAEKGGVLQVFIVSQKPKLKINIDAAAKEDIKIKASLLRIAEVIKEDK